ncbi:aldo/keto reductase [Acidisoma cellulosilytica]|uniref:Aldo/keto reductase n=1 Tax=Acidisoma cellulosilyticum TaxID=2802395 RepID=A0A964E5B1_9PROT|nr:aldo/keto reductase [Acidisoma cellulosilyticum]MCB8882227.1 aldo/keto reductase [Acidisoma cellulosilyticum]
MTDAFATRRIGKTNLHVTELGIGGTPFGNMYRPMEPRDVTATVATAMDVGIRYFDTAPVYGFGLSETRLGEGIRDLPRQDIVVSSKVGYSLVPISPSELKPQLWAEPPAMRADFDYTRDAVLRGVEESLKRLKTPYIDMLAIHDPDEAVDVGAGIDPFSKSHFKAAMDGAFPTLAELRAQGVIKAIGVGINQWQMLCDFAEAGDFDYFLLAGRYTLLDQDSMDRLLPLCEKRSISLIVGGPYNSGILATGAIPSATYDYRPASDAIKDKTKAIEAVCGRYGIPLQAAALQFPLLNPLVASIIPGARSVEEVRANAQYVRHPIPPDFWLELKSAGLIDPRSPVARSPVGG